MSAETRPYPWPAGSATGVGSLPGTDPAQAIAVVLGELPDLPYLPELPARGPGADLTGRTAALLVDLPVETTPGGWKFAARPGRDQRRASDLMSADLDALQQAAEGYQGAVKIQLCGPWTLAATIELSRSQEPVIADPGALADLIASLTEAAAAHVAQVRSRIPGGTVLLQLDEPALPGVLAGAIPTASGLNRVSAVDPVDASDGLRSVLHAATAFGVVHCCAADIPFLMLKDAGAGAVGFDASLLPREAYDALAEAIEAGIGILLGALPTIHAKRDVPAASPPPRQTASELIDLRDSGAPPQPRQTASGAIDLRDSGAPPQPRQTASGVIELWHRLGIPPGRLAEQVVITPACGLADASPAGARAAMTHCREAAGLLPELIEERTR